MSTTKEAVYNAVIADAPKDNPIYGKPCTVGEVKALVVVGTFRGKFPRG